MKREQLSAILEKLAALVGIEAKQLETVADAMATAFGPKSIEEEDAPLSVVALWAARRAQSLSDLLVQLEKRGQAALQPAPIDEMARDGGFLPTPGPYDKSGRPIRHDHPALRAPADDVRTALADMIDLALHSLKPDGWEARVIYAQAALARAGGKP